MLRRTSDYQIYTNKSKAYTKLACESSTIFSMELQCKTEVYFARQPLVELEINAIRQFHIFCCLRISCQVLKHGTVKSTLCRNFRCPSALLFEHFIYHPKRDNRFPHIGESLIFFKVVVIVYYAFILLILIFTLSLLTFRMASQQLSFYLQRLLLYYFG